MNSLRPDVAGNAKLWLAECRREGLDVELSNTLRDDEYQAYLYAQGRTRPGKILTYGKKTTFHGAGLAIDFYSRSTGYSHHDFFVQCGAIAKRYGFSWAGDWKSMVEYCHVQWDNHGKSNHMNAPQMPLYIKEEIPMTKDEAKKIVQDKAGLSDATIQFVADDYRYGDDLIVKLATAMQ
jgi:peptidoglycan L-alanyl-D-glutamate endopeptidase CwlK